MSVARRPSPFGELLSLRQAMDRLFEDSYVRSRGVPYGNVETLALPLDIYSTPDAIVVEAALPGVKPDDVEITVLGNTLTISGTSFEERASQEPDFMYQELRRGTFARTVALPSNLDTHNSTATFEHGMLRLSIPKAPEARPRQIRITPTHDSAGFADGGGDQGDQQSEGQDSWAAGTADTGTAQGEAESGAGGAQGAQDQAGWAPAAGTDAWTDPATAQAWEQPVAEGAETWGTASQGTETWGEAPATGETWSQDPYATTSETPQDFQSGDAQAGSWQPAEPGQWEDPTAQAAAGDGSSGGAQDESTSWSPQQGAESAGETQRGGQQARG